MAIKAQQIMDEIETRFRSITVQNEYNTDFGLSIPQETARNIHQEKDLNPVSGEWSGHTGSITVPDKRTNEEHRINIDFRGFCTATISDAEKLARKLLADVHKAVFTDPTWNRLAIRTLPGNWSIEISTENKTFAEITYQFSIVYVTSAGGM